MKKLIILFLCLFVNFGFSQDNSNAEILLNKVSENIKNYQNIYINYAYTLKNIEEDIAKYLIQNIFKLSQYGLTLKPDTLNTDGYFISILKKIA